MKNISLDNKESGQVVTFKMGKEIYGIDIFKVKEVLSMMDVTAIPNAPDFVKGVVQVRERVIPIIDLRKRLGLEKASGAKSRIVILDLERPIGFVVDEIDKVVNLKQAQIEAVPDAVVGDVESSCIGNLAKCDDRLVILLSPEKILSGSQMKALDGLGKDN